ncbi:carbamoyl phosphate synthase small subunit, partial [Clostridioides difficile]
IENIKALIGKKPIVGICLGHQLLALALGGKTAKLKFGHRGGNHPVKDLEEGKVFITSQIMVIMFQKFLNK